MKRWYLPKLAFGLGILVALFWFIGSEDVYQTLLSMNPLYLVAIVLLTVARIPFASYNMQILINPFKRIPFRTFFTKYLQSWIAGLMLPGRVGEFTLSYFLTKEGVRIGDSTASILLDKMISFFVASIIAVVGFFVFFPLSQALLLFGSLLVLWIGILLSLTDTGRALSRKILTTKYETKFVGFSAALFESMRTRRSLIVANIGLTIFILLIQTGMALLSFAAFGQQVDFFILFTITAIVTVVSFIPITFNGLGIREGAYVFLLRTQGVAASVSASVALMNLVVNYSIAAAIGILLISSNNTILPSKKDLTPDTKGGVYV